MIIYADATLLRPGVEITPPPLVGQQVYVASGDDDEGYYVYDGEQWVRHPEP